MLDNMKIFADTDAFQKWLRTVKTVIPDIVKIEGLIYTMDHYDSEGKELTFGNRKTGNSVLVETSDRYTAGFQDAVVVLTEQAGYSFCVQYME